MPTTSRTMPRPLHWVQTEPAKRAEPRPVEVVEAEAQMALDYLARSQTIGKRHIFVDRAALQQSRLNHISTGQDTSLPRSRWRELLPVRLQALFDPEPTVVRTGAVIEPQAVHPMAKLEHRSGASAAALVFLLGVALACLVHWALGLALVFVSFFLNDSAHRCSACHGTVKDHRASRCPHCTSFFQK